jgi:hypothetical protein
VNSCNQPHVSEEPLTPMVDSSLGIQEVVRRIRGEFLEMPGLRLTPEQARKLWRLDETACLAVLGALVDARFLSKTRDGAFVRDDSSSVR